MSKPINNTKLLGSGIILALASSLCCIGPLLALFGAAGGALSMFSWIEPLRPYLMLVTALVLGLAFYRVYKPGKKDGCGCDTKKRPMQSKAFLWIVTVISIGLFSFPYYEPYFRNHTTAASSVKNTNLEQVILVIDGMSCAACEGHVNEAVKNEEGVQEISTSYDEGRSTIKFDRTKTSRQQLAMIIENKTGYKVKK